MVKTQAVMESLLQVIVILSLIKFACKGTYYKKKAAILLFPAIAAVFAYIVYPLIIKINIQSISQILSDKTKISDFALLVTAEAITGIFVCVFILDKSIISGRKILYGILKLSPDFLPFMAISYIELKMFYAFPGMDFRLTALITALTIFILIFFISYTIKYLLPEETVRFELKFILNAILLIIAVILNAGLAEYNKGSYKTDNPVNNLLVFLSMVLGIGVIGFVMYKYKSFIKIYIKKITGFRNKPS